MNRHLETIKSQFQKQAANFSETDSNQANDKYINWILDSLVLQSDDKVLDVAGGTGILSRALAPRVNHVTAIDLSIDMLRQGQIETENAEIENVTFVEGAVEKLPFNNHCFDLVVCRFAFHHFVEPLRVLGEMKRVCKVGKRVAVIDIISPEDNELENAYNHYEILRDPSHVKALKQSDWIALFRQANLSIIELEVIDVEVDFTKWLALTKLDKDISDQITQNVIDEINGGKATGLRPFYRGDKLFFCHTFIKIIGEPLTK